MDIDIDTEKLAQSMSEIDKRVFMYMFENKSTLEKNLNISHFRVYNYLLGFGIKADETQIIQSIEACIKIISTFPKD